MNKNKKKEKRVLTRGIRCDIMIECRKRMGKRRSKKRRQSGKNKLREKEEAEQNLNLENRTAK